MRFANGDTLVARITPCLENGKTAFVDFLGDDEVGWGSTEYIVLKPKPPIPDEFAYCLARSVRFREFAVQNMSGTSGRQRVPATALSAFRMALPPPGVATAFGRAARSLLAGASARTLESRALGAIRDALLPKLVSGGAARERHRDNAPSRRAAGCIGRDDLVTLGGTDLVSDATLSESAVEDAALAWLEGTGWAVAHGQDIAPDTLNAERADYGEVVLEARLRSALARLNPNLPRDTLEDALRRLTRPVGATLETRNRAFHRMVVDGVTVEYVAPDGAVRGGQVRVVDFDAPEANDWLAVNQFTVVENKHERRPDIVLFVNGLPLAVIELKNPTDEHATIRSAFQQLQTYQAEIPLLFAFNAALVVSDGLAARIGTLTAPWEWFKPWRTIEGEALADSTLPQLQVLVEGACAPGRLLAVVRDFTVFEDDGSGALAKKMAGYHQFHAVETAVAETLRAARLQHDVDMPREWPEHGQSSRQAGGAPGETGASASSGTPRGRARA